MAWDTLGLPMRFATYRFMGYGVAKGVHIVVASISLLLTIALVEVASLSEWSFISNSCYVTLTFL